MKDVVMLGGPNGAGKTTAATTLLPADLNIVEFVNADEIARGLSPFNPEASALPAGRVMIERLHALVDAGESFAFETTCAGRSHANLLRTCRAAGYRLTLMFLWLPSAQMALDRVAQRVRKGGHRIPEDVVVRRYTAGIRNMRHLYLPLVDVGLIFDNADGHGDLIVRKGLDQSLAVYDPIRWRRIEEMAR